MRRTMMAAAAALALGLPASADVAAAQEPARDVVLVMHGGAGTILPENMTPEQEQAYRAAMAEALRAGQRVLLDGGSALDAVVASIVVLEDNELFNAGRGAVFTHEGANELDASIMEGATLAAGAIAGVKRVKNPIRLARLVMERSPHVLMAREGAEAFGERHGVEMVPESYFRTERRWQQLQRAIEAERTTSNGGMAALPAEFVVGTVGAVALDRHGNLAAGTSTGGMTNKRFGRIGDSPVIGAGTYASNESCAVSATGHGEFFIRNVVAYDICARMRYNDTPLDEAARQVVMERLVAQDATGGVVALDRNGNIAMPFNTPGMYRGFVRGGEEPVVRIFRD